VVGCCECGDEPSGSCATELVIVNHNLREHFQQSRRSTRRVTFSALSTDFTSNA
jgi:hypothetical protein